MVLNPTGESGNATVNATRVIRAAPKTVFDAWVVPDLRRRWWACGSCDVCEIDARVGGAYRIGTHDSGKGQAFIAAGVFSVIDPASRLVYTWSWEQPAGFADNTLVTVSFRRVDVGTRVEVTHSLFASDEQALPHRDGWEDGLKALAELLESMTTDPG